MRSAYDILKITGDVDPSKLTVETDNYEENIAAEAL